MPSFSKAPEQRARELAYRRARGKYDESDLRDGLTNEYKMLQEKIDKIGAFRFTIKGWSVTALVAGTAAMAGKGLAVNLAVILSLLAMFVFFLLLEYEQVKHSRFYGDRARRIEDALQQITRGNGLNIFDTFPVPFTAHDLVLKVIQERSTKTQTVIGKHSPKVSLKKSFFAGFKLRWLTTGRSTTASVPTARLHTEHLLSSGAHWAVEMWKAKNASHISTAPTTTARYTRPQTQTEELRLWLAEKNGAGHLDCQPFAQVHEKGPVALFC